MVTDKTRRNSALLSTTLASFLTSLMASSVNIALPSIGREFSADAVTLSWIATSFLLAAAMFLVPLGRIADMYGRKRIFAAGVGLFSLASLLSALAPSLAMLILVRFLQGIGASMIFATGMALLTTVFPAEERGRVLGINVASVYVGLSLGPFLGGILTQQLGWRSIFFFNVPIGVLILVFVFWLLDGDWADAKDERFDLAGSTVYSLSLVPLMYGFTRLPSLFGVILVLLGCAGIAAFIAWEMRVQSPVLNMNLFRHNTVFTFSNLAALINYSATAAVAFLLSLYLQYIKGFTPQHAGIILISQPIVMAVFSPFAGKLSDRVEPRIVASTGMTVTVVGLTLLAALNGESSMEYIVASLVLLGFGFALFSSPNTNAVMSSLDRRFYGVGSGILGTMRLVGQMLSMGIATFMFALIMGRVMINPEYYHLFLRSMKISFVISAVLCVGGVAASLARGTVRNQANGRP